MNTQDERLPPGQWAVTEQSESTIEYGRSIDCWTGPEPVRLAAIRVTSGSPPGGAGPLWVLQVKTGAEEFATTDRFGTAGCRDDARAKLYAAMRSLDRLIDQSEGHLGHERIVELLARDAPRARIQ